MRAVVASDDPGLAVDLDELFQKADHARCRKSHRRVDSKSAAVGHGDFVERAQRSSAIERIVHEIERSERVDAVDRNHGYRFAPRHPPLRLPPRIELHLAVDAMHPPVIPRPVHLPQPAIALPKGPTQLRCHQVVERSSVVARDTVVGT